MAGATGMPRCRSDSGQICNAATLPGFTRGSACPATMPTPPFPPALRPARRAAPAKEYGRCCLPWREAGKPAARRVGFDNSEAVTPAKAGVQDIPCPPLTPGFRHPRE